MKVDKVHSVKKSQRLLKTEFKDGISLLLLLCTFIFFTSTAFTAELCLDEQNAFKLDTVLKECRNDKEQLSLMNEALPKCEKQIEICKEQKQQDREICDKEIAAVKPTIFGRMKDMITGAGIAGIVLVIVVLAL